MIPLGRIYPLPRALGAATRRLAAALLCGVLAAGTAVADPDRAFWICGAPIAPDASRPADGPISANPEAPWMAKVDVVLARRADGAEELANCGGAVLSPEWIVTAAHCVKNKDFRTVRVRAGASDLRLNGQERQISAAYCRPGATGARLEQDVALLRLEEPLPSATPRLRLPSDAELNALRAPKPALTAGWPQGANGGIGDKLAIFHLWIERKDRRDMFVARAADEDLAPCVGGSGGPLVVNTGAGPALFGVFSAVDGLRDWRTGEVELLCSGAGARAYFTPLQPYKDWLTWVMSVCSGNDPACRPPG